MTTGTENSNPENPHEDGRDYEFLYLPPEMFKDVIDGRIRIHVESHFEMSDILKLKRVLRRHRGHVYTYSSMELYTILKRDRYLDLNEESEVTYDEFKEICKDEDLKFEVQFIEDEPDSS